MEKIAEKRRIVLVPFPEQGHINTMMLLGQALNLKGFSIIVAQGESNQVISPQHLPDFQFVIIRESVPMSQLQRFGPAEFMKKLNKTSEASFKDSMAQLLLQQGSDIACIIYDDFMYFSEAAAKEFKLPSVSISNVSATHQVCGCILSKVNAEKFLLVDMKDPDVPDKVVENLHPLRYKHLEDLGYGPLEPFLEIFREICSKKVSAMIINTATCLESSSLSWLQQELGIPVFPIGPLHITSSVNSSLLEEDMSCIEWLNKQKPRSVIYISFGSQAQMETKEVLEMAWGLYNSNQPFLWVIRPGSISGSEWLPEEVSKIVSEKGYIVKWAPQIQVLGHPAVGGYWCHSGWNSTLESIGEGVPMICMPFHGEQKLNAMYIESVWKIGIQIEGEVERGVVERAVKRLLVDEESASMRERALVLKEKVKASVRRGYSSYNALDEFVKFLEKVRN